MRDIYLRAKGRTVIRRGDMLDLIYHNNRHFSKEVIDDSEKCSNLQKYTYSIVLMDLLLLIEIQVN